MWQYDLLDTGFDEFEDIFSGVKSSVSDAIDNLREHFIYVPFQIGEIYYVLKSSQEFVNEYVKEWYVAKMKITEIRVVKTSKFEMVKIYLLDIEQPENLLCCVSSEYNKTFFKDEEKAKAECDEINSWLKSMQKEGD